ncbi:hypothetical protein GQ457_14G000690 [Hibiscus cannabinus]
METKFSPRISEADLRSSRASPLRDPFSPLTGSANGRPPDGSLQSVIPSRLERLAEPVSVEDQQVGKRSRGEEDDVMDVGLDKVGGTVSLAAGYRDSVCDVSDMQQTEERSQVKPSFRDMLAGNKPLNVPGFAIPELDVEMQEEDVQLSSVDGTPAIDFSDRIHDRVDAKLANSVIVRLLGRMIGYNALLNRIRSLWNPSGEIALVDLDNGYYLVRFANGDDVSRVLLGGPWQIYGNYLTVQPWSRSFTMTKEHPDQIVVWARLPGLPYRYYTKSMFRFIAGAIGKVIKIDYNTTEGKRGLLIDGKRQIVEYEGLPMICYTCGKYGHTVEVCKKGETNSGAGAHADMYDLTPADPDEKFGPWMQAANQEAAPHQIGLNQQNVSSHVIAVINDGAQDEAPIRGNALKLPAEGGNADRSDFHAASSHSFASKVIEIGPMGNSEVASADVVIPASVSINPKSHTTVRVLEHGANLGSKSVPARRGVAGEHFVASSSKSRLVGNKSGVQKESSIRKKQDPRSASKVVLGEWLGHMERDLNRSKDGGEELATTRNGESIAVESTMVWRENTSFDHYMRMILMSHEPDIDSFSRHGFPFSYMVKAIGLSGGIWVLWRHSKRDGLWNQLSILQPNGDIAWLLGGDFNSILSSDERMRGSVRRNAVLRGQNILGSEDRFTRDWTDVLVMTGGGAYDWGESIVRNIANFQRVASNWNRESFGHIGRRKHRLLARIRGIESATEVSTDISLQNLEISLKQELAEVLKQEESLWFQRSRTEWILEGDRNTKYYHRVTKSRERQKKCFTIKLGNGQWCLNPSLIREEVVNYFKEVFRSTAVSDWKV